MRIHYLQHVPFEGPARIGDWVLARGYNLTGTKFYEDVALPSVSDIDGLVVMGGPMNIYEEQKYPWLKQEREFISKAMS